MARYTVTIETRKPTRRVRKADRAAETAKLVGQLTTGLMQVLTGQVGECEHQVNDGTSANSLPGQPGVRWKFTIKRGG